MRSVFRALRRIGPVCEKLHYRNVRGNGLSQSWHAVKPAAEEHNHHAKGLRVPVATTRASNGRCGGVMLNLGMRPIWLYRHNLAPRSVLYDAMAVYSLRTCTCSIHRRWIADRSVNSAASKAAPNVELMANS